MPHGEDRSGPVGGESAPQGGAAARAPRREQDVGITCRRPGIEASERADPCVLVIFGASGDLARRQLLPSLWELARKDLLPEPFAVVGTALSDWDDEAYRREMRDAVSPADGSGGADAWDDFARRLHYVPMDFTSAPGEDYAALGRTVERARERHGIPDHVLYHLAVPPAFFSEIATKMDRAGLADPDRGWRRLVIEKPFGEDRESAAELDRALQAAFGEDQIYRIDHYLGKETVQNMLVFRFANPGWEPIWNRNYIDHVQITASETVGVGRRAGFYEGTGVVRDMVQNHLLQLFCMAAIEPPVRCLGTSVRDETAKVLQAVNPVDPEGEFVAGQYGAGRVDGADVPGYRQEEGVAADSTTPTFAALKLSVDNWRWAGVPFYLRTGKRLDRKLTEVVVHFRPTPHTMFPGQGAEHRNVLAFRLQPREGIVQQFAAKQPGPELSIEPVRMNFDYAGAFGVEEPPRAYAWLLLDAMQGDQTLFARSDWIRRAWSIVDPLVEHWEEDPAPELPNYAAGSRGPEPAEELIRRDGHRWTEI